jgi:hypothetical protein
VVYAPTKVLSPALQALLAVRRVVGLRNPAHSLVKMLNPMQGRALLVCSHTHPEYALSMTQTLSLIQANALLLRGTEGEPVADPRRTPAMTGFVSGHATLMCEQQAGSLTDMPTLPQDNSAQATAAGAASLTATVTLQPGQTGDVSIVWAWHFPHKDWFHAEVGNYYTNLWASILLFWLTLATEPQTLTAMQWTFKPVAALSLSCAAGVAMSYFAFLCRAAVSATSFTVIGNVCKVLAPRSTCRGRLPHRPAALGGAPTAVHPAHRSSQS